MARPKKAPKAELMAEQLPESEPEMDLPVVEMVPVTAEAIPASPPPFEAFMNMSVPAAEKLALPAEEVRRKVDRLVKETPTEGELERSHEVKHFDETAQTGASSLASLLAKIRRPIAPLAMDSGSDEAGKLPMISLNELRDAVASGSYKPAMIGGFAAGLGLLILLLLLGAVR